MNYKQLEIQKEIAKIQNAYPPDNLIVTYKDFLKTRDYLPLYQFNPLVFDSLVTLTCESWNSPGRINRQSLIELIKRYGTKQKAHKDYYSIQQTEVREFS